jgi:hypothetical protein
MFKKTLIAASLALVGATVFADGASAQRREFRIQDGRTGATIYDDGIEDGRACAALRSTYWDPRLQDFVTRPRTVCNFGRSRY